MCVCFFSKSSEEKINSFIVVVSSLNVLMDEQISNMKVFKGTENVAIVEEFEVPPKFYFTSYGPLQNSQICRDILKEKKNDSHGRASFSSQIVCRTSLCFVSLLT